MIFPWLFSFASVVFLLILNIFFDLHENSYFYLMAFGVISVFPLLLPVVDFIKKEEKKSEKLFTRAGIFWFFSILLLLALAHFALQMHISTLIFLFFLLLGAFFGLESRWYFFSGLSSLIFVLIALLLDKKGIAENLSVFLYLSLVAGVFVELFSAFFTKFHKNSREIITFSEKFLQEYKKEMKRYVYFGAFFLGFGQIILLFLQGRYLEFPLETYIFVSFAFVGSYSLYAFMGQDNDFSEKFFYEIFPFSEKKFFEKNFWKIVPIFAFFTSGLAVYLLNGVYNWWQATGLVFLITIIVVAFISVFFYFLRYVRK